MWQKCQEGVKGKKCLWVKNAHSKPQQQNEENQQMKIHIKNEQQHHKNLTGGSPKQITIAGSFWLFILKNDYRISYNKINYNF